MGLHATHPVRLSVARCCAAGAARPLARRCRFRVGSGSRPGTRRLAEGADPAGAHRGPGTARGLSGTGEGRRAAAARGGGAGAEHRRDRLSARSPRVRRRPGSWSARPKSDQVYLLDLTAREQGGSGDPVEVYAPEEPAEPGRSRRNRRRVCTRRFRATATSPSRASPPSSSTPRPGCCGTCPAWSGCPSREPRWPWSAAAR